MLFFAGCGPALYGSIKWVKLYSNTLKASQYAKAILLRPQSGSDFFTLFLVILFTAVYIFVYIPGKESELKEDHFRSLQKQMPI